MEVTRKHKIILIVLACCLFLGFGLYERMASRKNVYVLSGSREGQQVELASMVLNDSTTTHQSEKNSESEPRTIIVHIEGEVVFPGVYEVEEGSRVHDLVLLAGGLTPEADRWINLAQKLMDEAFVFVPALTEKDESWTPGDAVSVPGTITFQPTSSSANTSLVNINTADQKSLESLSGIGPVLAERIIRYREEKGPFQQLQDLKKVTGIGDKRYADIKDRITL